MSLTYCLLLKNKHVLWRSPPECVAVASKPKLIFLCTITCQQYSTGYDFKSNHFLKIWIFHILIWNCPSTEKPWPSKSSNKQRLIKSKTNGSHYFWHLSAKLYINYTSSQLITPPMGFFRTNANKWWNKYNVNEHNMVKNPQLAGGRPVGYLQAWPRSWTWDYWEQQNRTWTRNLRISSPAP